MKGLGIALSALVLAAPFAAASGQPLNARRTAMGGVVLPAGGMGGDDANVAYRAVPPAPSMVSGVSLPIGLIPLLRDPPVLDPEDPRFDVYEVASNLRNPPWNLQLVSPDPPSGDIVVELGRNHLSAELGEIGRLFPDDHTRVASSIRTPSVGLGIRRFFVGIAGVLDYENELSMNQALHRALAGGEEFRTHTDYVLYDDARGQAAAALQVGWAGPIARAGNPRVPGGRALYGGIRASVLRGIVYGEARSLAQFGTRDSVLANSPIDLHYTGAIRSAGPGGGGWGGGFDLGLVWLSNGFELGLGVDDIGTRIDWRVDESLARRDTLDRELVRELLRRDVPHTSRIPMSWTANAARKVGRVLVAADVTRRARQTEVHLGVESWLETTALRGGAGLDSNRKPQIAGGIGLRFGRMGVDLALATHGRTVSGERALELAAGLSLFPNRHYPNSYYP